MLWSRVLTYSRQVSVESMNRKHLICGLSITFHSLTLMNDSLVCECELFDSCLHFSGEHKEIVIINENNGLDRCYWARDIYEIFYFRYVRVTRPT